MRSRTAATPNRTQGSIMTPDFLPDSRPGVQGERGKDRERARMTNQIRMTEIRNGLYFVILVSGRRAKPYRLIRHSDFGFRTDFAAQTLDWRRTGAGHL